jgi:hypothetical protein
MLVLIGSRALEHHISTQRDPIDTDFIGYYDDIVSHAKFYKATSFVPFNGGKYIKMTFGKEIVEAEIAWSGSVAESLIKYVENDSETDCCGLRFVTPSLNFLYMLKMSHRYKKNSPHFLKTMNDIHLMRKHGACIPDSLQNLYKARMKETYNYPHPNLNQKKNTFFDSSVKYVYDHDSIHEAIRLYDIPAYEYYKETNAEVNCSKNLFFKQEKEIQLAGVYEEACVLAIERSLVPFPGIKTPRQAFEMALQKVCTSITSGWFREYAWEHYHEVMNIDPDCQFWDRFQNALKNGKVPFHKE